MHTHTHARTHPHSHTLTHIHTATHIYSYTDLQEWAQMLISHRICKPSLTLAHSPHALSFTPPVRQIWNHKIHSRIRESVRKYILKRGTRAQGSLPGAGHTQAVGDSASAEAAEAATEGATNIPAQTQQQQTEEVVKAVMRRIWFASYDHYLTVLLRAAVVLDTFPYGGDSLTD